MTVPSSRTVGSSPGGSRQSAGEPPRASAVLLVEDSPADADLVREALAESRLLGEVYVVADGIQALEFLHRSGPFASAPVPDLILLDLNLPRLGGREVLASVKQDATLRHIPIVVLSSSAAEDDVTSAYQHGADAYITKPVGLGQFWAAIRQIEEFWFGRVRSTPSRDRDVARPASVREPGGPHRPESRP